MLEKLSVTDEIWNKPWWVGFFSVVVSLMMFLGYSELTEMEDYEEGIFPAILIPAIVAPTCSVFINRYVKRIRRQNQKLAELNAINRKLLSILTHDVRSPLIEAKGFMELQFSGELSQENFHSLGKELLSQVDHVLNLQTEILKWAERQEGLKPVMPQYFEIDEVIKSIVSLYGKQLREKELRLQLENVKGRVYSDQDIFSFVFRNIYHNAIKFTPKGGIITVRTNSLPNTCEVTIQDTGIGIGQDELDNIMNPNEYFSKKGTENERGTGFGLNAVLHYLKECNASLAVESEVGKGSTFRIILPVNQ